MVKNDQELATKCPKMAKNGQQKYQYTSAASETPYLLVFDIAIRYAISAGRIGWLVGFGLTLD
jgi:hypothetical protein